MIFPFTSPYLYLMGRGRDQDPMQGPMRRRKPLDSDPWDIYPGPDDPRQEPGQASFHGNERPQNSGSTGSGRWAGLGAGLTALGTSLLSAAPHADWAGGLAQGGAAFTQAFGEERDRIRQEDRLAAQEQQTAAQERRAEAQETDRGRAASQAYTQGQAEFEAWKDQQERGRATRERTGKSADQMVAEIQALASRNPKDEKLQAIARRAAGYALGEDSDLNKLADLHEQMTAEAFHEQDYADETKLGIDRSKARIGAGVEADPKVAEAQANRGLNISAGHLAVAQQQTTDARNRITDLQAYDRIQKRVQEKLEPRIKAYQLNDSFGRVPPPDVIEKWRAEALKEAMGEFENQLNAVTAYDYTPDGRLIRR